MIQTIIYILLLIYIITDTFCFRFQRATLQIARSILGQNYMGGGHSKYAMDIELLLSPNWYLLLIHIVTLLKIALTIMLWIYLGWQYAIIFLFWILIGSAITDNIIPIPSFKFCRKIIRNHLQKTFTQTMGEQNREKIYILLEAMDKIENSKPL